MARLTVEYRQTQSLIPYVGNARTHTDAQVDQIARSISEFGFVNPVLIDKHGVIIAGHGRVMAAMRLGMDEVPVIQLGGLSERQVKALVLADNKIALNSGWDMAKLADEISALADMEMDLGVLGFDEQELDALLKSDNSILPDNWDIPQAGTFQTAPSPVPTEPPPSRGERVDAAPMQPEAPLVPQQPQAPQPPAEFKAYDEDLKVEHRCPSCGYEWSGKPK